MSRNLIAALKADGKTGSAGQSMKNDLTGAAAGRRLTDWLIPEVAFSGEPLPDIMGGYSSGHVFNITATFTRGSQAYRIQRNLSSAWTISTLGSDTIDARASVTSFSASGSPAGATHALNIQVTGSKSGTVNDTATVTQDTSGAEFAAWPITQFSLSLSGGGSGQTEVELILQYNPDSAAFNPVLDNLDGLGVGWKFMMDRSNYSTSDFDIEWHDSSAFDHTSFLTSGSTLPGSMLSSYYPTSTDGLFGGEEITMYVRYRAKGSSGSWSLYNGTGAVFFEDPRPAV